VIDDDADFRDALGENLREDGYLVYCYECVAGLPPLAMLPHVDLVVIDTARPSAADMAFAEAWHRAVPDVPVLVLTSDPGSAWDAWADRLGGVEVRRKPIDYERIRSTLTALSARLAG
jgi:two-component system OmpR family response regulator